MHKNQIISSKSRNDNFIIYLIFEIIMVAVVTFIAIGFLTFYIFGRLDSRGNSNFLERLFETPLLFGSICIVPAVFGVLCILYLRSRNYIVAYSFNDAENFLKLEYRGVIKKETKEIEIDYSNLIVKGFKERKVLFNQSYKGISFDIGERKTIDFVSNNFIWEKQPRERKAFMQQIKEHSRSI